MNNQSDNLEPKQVEDNGDNQLNEEQSEIKFKPKPILFAFTIGGALFSFFCYLVLDLRLPAILIVLIIVFVNYIVTKREYDELKKSMDEKKLEQIDKNDKKY